MQSNDRQTNPNQWKQIKQYAQILNKNSPLNSMTDLTQIRNSISIVAWRPQYWS